VATLPPQLGRHFVTASGIRACLYRRERRASRRSSCPRCGELAGDGGAVAPLAVAPLAVAPLAVALLAVAPLAQRCDVCFL